MSHIIDAKGRILGRVAVEAANLLRGKGKPEFVPHLDKGDEVTVINTDRVVVSGKKLKSKIYWRHSGYPGGLKGETLEGLMARDSREAVRRAVYGMLPTNKLRDRMIVKLKLFKKDAN